jgi:hypothetical protein
MSATARIMAYLGLDASGFKTNIDGATSKLNSMAVSMQAIRRTMGAALAVGGLSAVVSAYKELKEYQKDTGIKIMSDDDMRHMEAAANTLTRIKMEVAGLIGGGLSKFVQGWKAFWAGLASGGDAKIMAESIADIEGLTLKLAEATKKVADAEKKRAWDAMSGAQRAEALRKELALLDGQLRVEEKLYAEGRKRGMMESEDKARQLAIKELQLERLTVQQKLADAVKQEGDELERTRKAQADMLDAEQKRDRLRREAERAESKEPATLPSADIAEDLKAAEQHASDIATAGQQAGESYEAFAKRLADADAKVAELKIAYIRQVRKEQEDAWAAEDARAEVERLEKAKERTQTPPVPPAPEAPTESPAPPATEEVPALIARVPPVRSQSPAPPALPAPTESPAPAAPPIAPAVPPALPVALPGIAFPPQIETAIEKEIAELRAKAEEDVQSAIDELADAKKKSERIGEPLPGETRAEYEKRRDEAKAAVLKQEIALQERLNKLSQDEADIRNRWTSRLLKMAKDYQREKEDILGGASVRPKGIEMTGGLQSIGGYFLGAGQARMAAASRAEKVQDEIRQLNKRMAQALESMAGEG